MSTSRSEATSSTRRPRIFRSALLVIAVVAAISGCRNCERDNEPTVIVDDGGPQSRALKRPFDIRHRDSGIPRFHPRLDASSDASDAVME